MKPQCKWMQRKEFSKSVLKNPLVPHALRQGACTEVSIGQDRKKLSSHCWHEICCSITYVTSLSIPYDTGQTETEQSIYVFGGAFLFLPWSNFLPKAYPQFYQDSFSAFLSEKLEPDNLRSFPTLIILWFYETHKTNFRDSQSGVKGMKQQASLASLHQIQWCCSSSDFILMLLL